MKRSLVYSLLGLLQSHGSDGTLALSR